MTSNISELLTKLDHDVSQVLEEITIPFSTADDFLAATMSPLGQYYSLLSNYIFRGHSKQSYTLIPSILRDYYGEVRKSGLKTKSSLMAETPQLRGFERIQKELNLLKEFYTRANNNGLKLPKVSSFFDDYSTPESLYDMLQKNGNCWPLKDLVELAGLAQHYEIPTRLLDWSTDFYVACYFACVKTFDRLLNKNNTKDFHFEKEISEPMAIFALDIETLKHMYRGRKGNLRFIRPSYADNPNLNAQKGLFTYWELEPEFDPLPLNNRKQYPRWWGWIETDIVPLEVLIVGYQPGYQPQAISQKMMYKFVVPSSQCISLYDHLRRLGYGKARLFPGYAGVKSEIDEDRDAEKVRELIASHVVSQK